IRAPPGRDAEGPGHRRGGRIARRHRTGRPRPRGHEPGPHRGDVAMTGRPAESRRASQKNGRAEPHRVSLRPPSVKAGLKAPATTDPITLEICWNRLVGVVNDQAAALQRTSFTSIVREAGDLSAGVFDRRGYMVAPAGAGTPRPHNSMGLAREPVPPPRPPR